MRKEINEMIEDSQKELEKSNTNYLDVLNSQDTEEYGITAENNNFSAGRISACKEILKMMDDLGLEVEDNE